MDGYTHVVLGLLWCPVELFHSGGCHAASTARVGVLIH